MFAVSEKRLTVSDHIGPRRTNVTYRAVSAINFPPALHAEGQVGGSLDIENYCTVSLFFEQAYLSR
ncbi:hypothetical protein BTM80_13705 [Salmonella enterica]|nr:hypothetical protein [Salmonella enterica]EDT9957569.1 hypothetical protein [Salmonella enterica subsp. enterica serovar Weltevreden]EDV7803838.1 hypothetical protein [Salmonella enterica subsp. enterica serovar Berta]EBI4591265.1 hypothetical protein [Salmonella enterica]EBK9866973.1 hypothetical protein [Salmonella enterica]